MASVYALMDPRTHQVCYIGKALDVMDRERRHFNQSKYERTPKGAWLRELRSAGLRADVIVLEDCDAAASGDREKYWIARALSRRVPLLNRKCGGQGRIVTPAETRRRISEAVKGKGHGPEWRAAHAATLRGRKASAETRLKMGAARQRNQNARKWDYVAIFPDGRREAIENIAVFCQEHGVAQQNLHKIAATGKGRAKGLHFVRTERRSAQDQEHSFAHYRRTQRQ